MTDEEPTGFTAWVQRHTEIVWAALCVVFLIYAGNSAMNLAKGQLGIDDFNVIGVGGGVVAAVAAGIIAVVAYRARRRDAADGESDDR